ncbi:MAG: hypothetical protein ABI870_12115, partial [Rhodanobacter sp.]
RRHDRASAGIRVLAGVDGTRADCMNVMGFFGHGRHLDENVSSARPELEVAGHDTRERPATGLMAGPSRTAFAI